MGEAGASIHSATLGFSVTIQTHLPPETRVPNIPTASSAAARKTAVNVVPMAHPVYLAGTWATWKSTVRLASGRFVDTSLTQSHSVYGPGDSSGRQNR